MENAPFWLWVVTAVAIPVGNAIFAGISGWVGDRVGRDATKYSADLQAQVGRETAELQARETRIATEYAANLEAAQRRRDVEIAQMLEAQTALLTAATAVQSYAWYANKRVSLGVNYDGRMGRIPTAHRASHSARNTCELSRRRCPRIRSAMCISKSNA